MIGEEVYPLSVTPFSEQEILHCIRVREAIKLLI